jgi:hypothetical protein
MPSSCLACAASPTGRCANRCPGTSRQKKLPDGSPAPCGNHKRIDAQGRQRGACKFHGGNNRVGEDAPNFKHGLGSRFGPPKHIAARIAELERDPRILDLRHIGAYAYAMLEHILSAVAEGAAITQEQAEAAVPLLRELRRAGTDHQKLQIGVRLLDTIETEQIIRRAIAPVLQLVPEDLRDRAIAAMEAALGVEGDHVGGDQPGTPGRIH